MAVIWNTSCKNSSFELETSNQCFNKLFLYQILGLAIFLFFVDIHVSVINH